MSWSPHVVVASIVERDGKFLLVEERVNERLVLNQPAGHWEQGETLIEAARREALEESAWDVEPTALLGIYHYQPENLAYSFLRVAFVAEARKHHPQRKLDDGIERAVWLTADEIAAQHARHRSPMLMRCIDDYLAGRRYPLSILTHL
ncbi:MAG TPA: NUDIX hydrolase [Nevskiaceae bacterium]|nr:NUDIX hydrolase [Nevskiaceae bacterium]